MGQEHVQAQFDVGGCEDTVERACFKVVSQFLNGRVELPQLGEVAIEGLKPCALLGGEIALGCPSGRGVLEQVKVGKSAVRTNDSEIDAELDELEEEAAKTLF